MGNKLKIYIPGIEGMVGSAIADILKNTNNYTIIGSGRLDVNLLNYEEVFKFLEEQKPDIIIFSSAKVGGGHAIAKQPVEFLEENILMQINLMKAAINNDINKVIFIASSALYPSEAANPIKEDSIFNGKLDSVQEAYGLAKLVGLHQTKYYNQEYKTKFITAVLNNVIGNKDNGQVVYSLIKQMVNAKLNNIPSITIWGSGEQRREFIFAEDVGRAIKLLIEQYDSLEHQVFNIGVQSDISIKELAYLIKSETGFEGQIIFDLTKPEGVKQRMLDSSKIFDLGFTPETSLSDGIRRIYESL